MTMAITATAAKALSVSIKPVLPEKATTGSVPRSVQKPRWLAPRKLPIAKKGSATRLTALPLPALTKVPEPQPNTICIAIPKTNAPPTIAKPIGACAPTSSAPLEARSGKASNATKPMARSCANRPAASRRRIIARQGPAKPKRSPSSVIPKPRPINSKSP